MGGNSDTRQGGGKRQGKVRDLLHMVKREELELQGEGTF